jgi:hypothetical protein
MLRDKVEDFIANRANPTELHELLSECMDDGSVEGLACVRRLYQDMYGGITYNFKLKAAAASCLLFWGEAGLQAFNQTYWELFTLISSSAVPTTAILSLRSNALQSL